MSAIDDLAIKHKLWSIGRPGRYLRDVNQKKWAAQFQQTTGPVVLCVGRQVGKSYDFFVTGHETMLQKPGAIVRYCAKTKDSAWAIAQPNLERIWADCPEEFKPRPNPKRTDELVMPHNGSKLVIFGTDAQSFDKGRGPFSDLIGFDECGFYQDLEGVESALLPSLQTTGGRPIYLSTPSESPAHPYALRCQAARAKGTLIHATIYDNPRIDVEAVIRDECDRLGMTRERLLQSTYWRREYMAEWVTEESRAAMPAWDAALEKRVTKAVARPKHFNAYVAVDWGGHEGDPHAALFGYHDFDTGRLVIEEEFERHGGTLTELAFAWKEVETLLWGVTEWVGTLRGGQDWELRNHSLPGYLRKALERGTQEQPFLRAGDHNDGYQSELIQHHGYAVMPTNKHDPGKHAMIDRVNSLLAAERIIISPKCSRLREQLYSTLWDKSRQRWERTPKDHGDLVDCLAYMTRNVAWNVAPEGWKPKLPPPNSLEWYEKNIEQSQQQIQKDFEDQFARNKRQQRPSDNPLDWL